LLSGEKSRNAAMQVALIRNVTFYCLSSLPDLKNRSEKVAERGQILTILKTNSCSIGRKAAKYDRSDAFAADFL
jgi:hypothetical protein